MTTDTRIKIMGYIKTNGQARAADLVELLGIGNVAVHRQLKKLVENGQLVKDGKPPKVFYELAGDGSLAGYMVKKVRPVLVKHGVKRSELFGSVARGDARLDSDVDILVEMPPESSLLGLGRLYMDLKEAVGREVDVVEYDMIHLDIKPYVFDKTVRVI